MSGLFYIAVIMLAAWIGLVWIVMVFDALWRMWNE